VQYHFLHVDLFIGNPQMFSAVKTIFFMQIVLSKIRKRLVQ